MRGLMKIYNFLTNPFRRSIRNKLILTMIVLSVAPIIAVTGLAAENSRKSLETEVIQTNLSNMKWTGIYLGEQLTQLNNLIYTILISPQLNDYLFKFEGTDLSSQFAAQKNIVDTLTSVFYSGNHHVVGVELFVKERNKLFAVNGMQIGIASPERTPPPYEELFKEKKDFLIRTTPGDPSKFQLIRSINRFEDREKLGGVSLEVRWALLDQTLTLLRPSEEHAVLIAGPDGRILYPIGTWVPSREAMEKINQLASGTGYLRTKDDYLFYNIIDPWGLKLIKIIPKSFINQSAKKTMQDGFIVGSVSVLISILIAVFLAWRTANPIVRLARSMQGLSLIKETEVPLSNRVDEIGLLETKLHHMSHRIREHIKTEYSMNLEKRTAELKALQAQINPHFLQNTLQLIGSMLFSTNPRDSYEIIKALSDMFRYVIREPGELASIRSEIEHLHNYMRIQKRRFASRLRFAIEVDPDAASGLIPKLTLQPIVENAFIHGLDRKTGDWELNVSVSLQRPDVLIKVQDNGVGIGADRMAELRKQLENLAGQVWTDGERIGLKNVASRIVMHFGPAYGVMLESVPNKGTSVMIRIPFVPKEDSSK
ncbi:sensor histidine kinase [Cohnella laeviribosi]|uniref:sensor histidine kinase n=1 Tax=Cohnella laeviribosi TaxID=380174 RepID=UPI0003695F13|nr:sensor histidine kinase [Cohnella laeviribosi]